MTESPKAPEKPATPAAAEPPPVSGDGETPQAANESSAPPGDEVDLLSVTFECFRCGQSFSEPCRHIRSGVVFFCPACRGTYVVTTELSGRVQRAVSAFRRRREEESKKGETDGERDRELGELRAILEQAVREVRPPGKSRPPAGLFG